jgi:hypothetical protein
MKKLIIMFAAAGLMLATPSCKKGENDPFLSFSSRDSRITGKWVLTSSEFTSTNTSINGGTTVINVATTTFDGTLQTTASGGNSNSISYAAEMTLDKDGSYTTKVTDDGDVTEASGYWWWLNDAKKKTRVAFDDDWNSFEIDQLKGKEMIIIQNTSSKDTQSNGDSDETVNTFKATYTKEK